jgi:4-hydroxyphenylpyruvate dioxygenase
LLTGSERADHHIADHASQVRTLGDLSDYYDYVAGRFGVDEETVAALRAPDLLHDRSPDGEFIHFYTRTVGSVFFDFVERRGNYDGYGTDKAPVRLADQRTGRVSSRR